MVLRMAVGICMMVAAVFAGAGQAVAAEELLVSAAASLTDAFKEIGKAYEQKHPGLTVRFNFAATGPLLQQIEQGAPVDVFASADQQSMDKAVKGGFVLPASRTDFTGNALVLITPVDNKMEVKGIADLQSERVVKICIGHPESVPVGRYTKATLEQQGVWETLTPKMIHGSSVKQVLEYVTRGEVDAGFVYATDAVIAGEKVKTIAEISTVKPVVYPVAVVAASAKKEQAQAFIDYLKSADGQAVLVKFGFKKM